MGEEVDPYFVRTRTGKSSSSHQVVVFKEKKVEKKKEKEEEEKIIVEEIDMKKARFEVYKFSKSGLPNPDKQKSNIELALRLGAVPPKNEAVNYKQYKLDKQKEKKDKMQRKQLVDLGIEHRPLRYQRKRVDPKAALKQKRRIGSGILNVYGTVSKK